MDDSFYADYINLIRRIVNGVLGRNRPMFYLDEEDLIQVGMLAAWKALSSYNPQMGPTASQWVAKKAEWAILDEMRVVSTKARSGSQSRPELLPVDFAEFDHPPSSHDFTGPEAAEFHRRLSRNLTDRQSEVLNLILSGHRSVDIAHLLGVDESCVSIHRRNIKKLAMDVMAA